MHEHGDSCGCPGNIFLFISQINGVFYEIICSLHDFIKKTYNNLDHLSEKGGIMMLFPPRPPNQQNQMPHAPMNQMMGYNRPVRPSGIQQLIQRFTTSYPPGTSLTTKGISGLANTLNNVQQVLKVVQSAAPIVQEYGPMIKNLPAMYRMFKAMKEINNEEEKENEDGDHKNEEEINEQQSKTEEPNEMNPNND